MPHPRYGSQEIVDKGKEIYEHDIRSRVIRENKGKYLAIDIETGEYELADEHLDAADRILDKHPGAPIYVLRVGYPVTAVFGTMMVAEGETDPE